MMKETVTLEKAGLGVVQGIVFVPKTPIKLSSVLRYV